MLKWVLVSNAVTRALSEAGGSQRRPVDEPKTPAPRRRMRHLRADPEGGEAETTTATQLPQPRPEDAEVETATDAVRDGVETLGNGAFRVGPRPRVVQFDVPDDEEEETTYEYYPPGVPVPPSRRQLFLNRPRRPRPTPPPPSLEVQIAMAQIRAEIQLQENPPPRTLLGHLIEHYRIHRECLRIYGKTVVRVEGRSYRAKKRLVSVCQALRRWLCCVPGH